MAVFKCFYETNWFWNHESRQNIHQSMWIQWQFLQKLEPKVIDPKMTFDPTSVEVLHVCVSLPKDHCVQVPWKYIKVCGYSDLFCKNLKRRSLIPRWPLTPHLLRSHVWLYPRIIVSKSHENTLCGYSDRFCKNLNQRSVTPRWPLTPHLLSLMCDSTQGSLCPSPMKIHQSMWTQWPFLQKTWTKGHWPLDDLWPHIRWGHMCDSTQGSLCSSPMKIHQSMWIQWTFLLKLEPKVIDP